MNAAVDFVSLNPFPGLRAFLPAEADRFFGRQQQIDTLSRRLADVPFLVVSGTSGCGKSSLVLAGLLNHLAGKPPEHEGTQWRYVVMTPGNRPIANLAHALAATLTNSAAVDDTQTASLDGHLRLGGLALIETVRLARLPGGTRVLVVVDQFEELFRFRQIADTEEASAFVKLLLHAVGDLETPVSVVITLRSDTLGHCADFRDLPEAVDRGLFLVPRLERDQRRDAIVRPIEMRGASIAPRLVQRLLNDISNDFDDLPIMQHVLTRIWDQWARSCQGTRAIDLEDYNAVGGVAEALSRHADEAYGSLTDQGPLVERIFRALTERLPEGTEVRRPLDFLHLCAVTAAPSEDVARVVDRYREPRTAFLRPSPEVSLASNPVIDISHECLIRGWNRLREWVSREADARRRLSQVVQAAAAWKCNEGELWRGRQLSHVREWQDEVKPHVAWVALYEGKEAESAWTTVQQFVLESTAAADRERRRQRRGRWSLLGLGALSLAILIVFLLKGALALKRETESGDLTRRALLEMREDPARSARFALEARERDPDNAVAEFPLRQAMANLEVVRTEAILEFDGAVNDLRYNPSRTRLVLAEGHSVHVLDPDTLKATAPPLSFDEESTQAWMIGEDRVVVVRRGLSGPLARSLERHADTSLACASATAYYQMAVSRDGSYVAVACDGVPIQVWTVGDGAVTVENSYDTGSMSSITALAFSDDSQYLAGGDADGRVSVWKLGSRDAWIRSGGKDDAPMKQRGAILDMAFYPKNSNYLATASDDRTAVVWQLDLDNRTRAKPIVKDKTFWSLPHQRPVATVKFAPRVDEDRTIAPLLFAVSNKQVYVWSNGTDHIVLDHDDNVNDIDATQSGELVATANSDGTASIWTSRSTVAVATLRGHRGQVTKVLLALDGRHVITAGMDHTVRAWRLDAPHRLADHGNTTWILSTAFDSQQKQMAWCGERAADGAVCKVIRVHDAEARQYGRAAPLMMSDKTVGVRRVKPNDVVFPTFSSDGRLLLGCAQWTDPSEVSRPVLWRADTKEDITPEWLKTWVCATFSPSTNEVMTIARDGSLALYDSANLMHDSKPEPKFPAMAPLAGRWYAEISPDGRWIAAIDGNQVSLWPKDHPDAAPRLLKEHRGDIMSAQFSRDSRWIVTASTDRTARVWPVDPTSVENNHAPRSVELAGGNLSKLASASFSPDGLRVVTAGADRTIRIWDARTGLQLGALERHTESVNDVKFWPDGQILSASDDGTLQLGPCHACFEDVRELAKRAPDEAILTKADKQDLLKASTRPGMRQSVSDAIFGKRTTNDKAAE